MRYTEGVCDDGAAILDDGQMVTISDVLQRLNSHDALLAAAEEVIAATTTGPLDNDRIEKLNKAFRTCRAAIELARQP